MVSDTSKTILKAQDAFKDAAEALGVEDDNDIQTLVDEVRSECLESE